MFEFLSKQVEVTYYGVALVLALFILVFVVIFLYIKKIKQELKKLKHPKYGFAGKSLYTILGLLLMVTVIPLTLMVADKSTDFRYSAETGVDVMVSIDQLTDSNMNTVAFSAIPYLDGHVLPEEYKVNWIIKGKSNTISKNETNLDVNTPSYFTKNLADGSYIVDIEVITSTGNIVYETRTFNVK